MGKGCSFHGKVSCYSMGQRNTEKKDALMTCYSKVVSLEGHVHVGNDPILGKLEFFP